MHCFNFVFWMLKNGGWIEFSWKDEARLRGAYCYSWMWDYSFCYLFLFCDCYAQCRQLVENKFWLENVVVGPVAVISKPWRASPCIRPLQKFVSTFEGWMFILKWHCYYSGVERLLFTFKSCRTELLGQCILTIQITDHNCWSSYMIC